MVGRAVTLFTRVGVLFSTVTVDTMVDSLEVLCDTVIPVQTQKKVSQ